MKYGEATMGQFEAVINKLGGMEGLQKFLSGELVVKLANLLQRITTKAVTAVKKFSAEGTFSAKKPFVRFYFQNDEFKEFFLSKVEENVQAVILVVHRLKQYSLDLPILCELGDRVEISLAHFWELLSQQTNGEGGILLTNGWSNIFYIRDIDGNLWAVSARWQLNNGWCVYAYSVMGRGGWTAGDQVFSG